LRGLHAAALRAARTNGQCSDIVRTFEMPYKTRRFG
jgi:hypothetical protein